MDNHDIQTHYYFITFFWVLASGPTTLTSGPSFSLALPPWSKTLVTPLVLGTRFGSCCDWKCWAAYAQSFAPWQQATVEITRWNHSISDCSCHINILVFFVHILFVVNPVPSLRGGFGGLSPPNRVLNPPNQIWNTINHWRLYQLFNFKPPRHKRKAPPHECKAPLVKISWRRSGWITHSTQRYRRGCNNISSFLPRTALMARSFCEGFTWHDLHILVTAPFCCDRKSEGHMRKASHRGSKQH